MAMKVYHYTSRGKWENMQPTDKHPDGGISTSYGINAFHPDHSDDMTKVLKKAFWAMPDKLPKEWDAYKADRYGLGYLFNRCADGDELVLLEIELDDADDVWVADCAGFLKDIEGKRFPDMTNYESSMRRYKSKSDLKGIKYPEIICFNDMPVSRIREIPVPARALAKMQSEDINPPQP